MTITIWEAFDSAKTTDRVGGQGSSAEFSVIIEGSNHEAAMRQALWNFAPSNYYNLTIQDVAIGQQLAPDLWRGSVRYGWPDDQKTEPPGDTNESLWSFDTTGSTTHITQALETIDRKAVDSSGQSVFPCDFFGAIGAHKDGVDGVDIVVPSFKFQETHWLPKSFVTLEYAGKLMQLTGTVNDAAWRKFKEGEVLFLGASGTRRGRGDWEIQFNFEGSPNVTNKTIGQFTGINKKGHEYIWFAYEDHHETGAKRLVKRPFQATIVKVYEGADFGELGISGPLGNGRPPFQKGTNSPLGAASGPGSTTGGIN